MTTPDKAYRWWYRDPLTKIFFKGTFAKIGVRNLRWTNYAGIAGKTPEQRDQLLTETERAFAALRPRDSPGSALAQASPPR
jgi:NAD(P)H dehydrogenase (quinone)